MRVALDDHLALRLAGSEAGPGAGLEIAVRPTRRWTPWDWNLQLAPALSGGVEWVGSGGSPVWDVAPSGDAIFSLRPTEASALTLAARFTRSWSAFGVQSAMTAGLGYAVRVGKVELRPEVTFSYLTGGRGEFFELYPSLTVAGAAR